MKEVLTLIDHYLPGFKAGGSIKAIASLIAKLGNHCSFKIITADRDKGDPSAYSEIIPSTWQSLEQTQVYYLPPGLLTLFSFYKLLNNTRYEILYLNSFFSPRFTIYPLLLRRLCLFKPHKIILAPRGELSEGALSLKVWKKSCILSLLKFVAYIII